MLHSCVGFSGELAAVCAILQRGRRRSSLFGDSLRCVDFREVGNWRKAQNAGGESAQGARVFRAGLEGHSCQLLLGQLAAVLDASSGHLILNVVKLWAMGRFSRLTTGIEIIEPSLPSLFSPVLEAHV